MALYPRQNSNFCSQHHCLYIVYISFSHPNINFYNSTLPIHNSMSIFQMQRGSNMLHSYSIFDVFKRCKMQSNLVVFCTSNQYPDFAFKFLCLTCGIHVFQCNINTWGVCCGAECDMLPTQSNIWIESNIELHASVTWPWDGDLLDKLSGLKIIAHGVPVIPDVPGDAVMGDSGTSAKVSVNNAKATLCRVAEQLLTLANRGGLCIVVGFELVCIIGHM